MEYQRTINPYGVMLSLAVVVIMGAIAVGGLWAVGNSVAESVGHVASVVNTGTIERNTTERTQIEWDARVQIEAIKADATKKTDFTFLLFWLARFGCVALVAYWVVMFVRKALNYGATDSASG